MSKRGFTLLEVLISTTILAFLVIMLGQMLKHVGRVWSQGHAQMEKSDGGRAVLDFMAKELQAAVLPVDRTNKSSYQLLVNPSISSDYKNRDAIFWQAPMATDVTVGDTAEFGYFVKWDTTNATSPRARLCRFFVNPGTNNVADASYLISSKPNEWITNDVIQAVAPADASNANSPYQGLFVENVIGLWITCMDAAGNTISQNATGNNTFDSRLGFSYTDVGGSLINSTGTCTLPAAIDLSFVMLDSNAANRITPSLRSTITTLVRDTKIRNANDFVAAALADPAFKAIRSGLCPFMTRVYLQNSK